MAGDGEAKGMERSLPIGAMLRHARRVADLSQRELSARSGVSPGTISRAELDDGRVRLHVVQALLAACGFRLGLLDSRGRLVKVGDGDTLRDRAGRRYPAHLDVRSCSGYGEWWGDCFIGAWGVPPRPEHTFDLSRAARDRRRRGSA
jgi:transcriptional regulator with XRE-family HTH domain